LAVVGLHGNTFKPHTGTKTSVLFVQKWNDDPKVGALCPRRDDYNIFFATMQKSGKDNSGEKIYRRIVHQDEEGLPEKEKERQFLLDPHNHLIVDHDLYNHEGLTEDGIAEAFIEFAKKEKLSFFEPSPSVTPFDAVRYQRLMDGLEAADVKYSEILSGASTLRFDSEYYKKEFLADEKILKAKSNQFEKFSHLDLAVDASAFYPSIEPYYGEGDLPFLRVADVNTTIDYNNCATIPNQLISQHPTLKKVIPGDILLTKGGSVARVGLVTHEAAVSRDLIFIDSAQLLEEDQIYLYLYFQTNFCNRLLLRSSSQSVQSHLTITLVRELELFKASEPFKFNLKRLVNLGQNQLDSSQEIYQQAEDLLLSELGLQDWQPTEETVAVKSFAESFLACDRLDAEYYQPKQQKVMEIMRQSGLCIGDVAPLVKRKFQPDKQGEFNYIEIGNLSEEGFANGEVVAMDEAPSRAQWIVKPNDVITSTVRPIRKLSALIEPEQNNYICSSGFAVLKPTQIEPEVLLVYLRSPIVCEILDLHTTASMYPAISTEDLLNIPITLPKESTRQKITEKVRESRKAREQSKQLLEISKIGVERAIEADEATATAWINQQLKVLGISPLFKGGRGDP
jgi:type I restriction enzyme M protein